MTKAIAAFAISAWVGMMMLMTMGPKYGEVEQLASRVRSLEDKKCVLMVVNTPNGVSSICVVQ